MGVSAGECSETRPALRRLGGSVRGLPSEVDGEFVRRLRRGVTHLERLFETQCKRAARSVDRTGCPSARREDPYPLADRYEAARTEDHQTHLAQDHNAQGAEDPRARAPYEGSCDQNPSPVC